MKHKRFPLVLLVLLCVATVLSLRSSEASETTQSEDGFIKGEVIVEIINAASIDDVNERNNTDTIQRIYGTNIYRLKIPKGKSEKKWMKRLSRDPEVVTASLNVLVTSPLSVFGRATQSFPNNHAETGRSQLEYLSQNFISVLKLDQVAARSQGRNVVVAVIDTGVDRNHPAIASHLWQDERPNRDIDGDHLDNDNDGLVDDSHGWDFVDNDNDPTDELGDPNTTVSGHGTFICGLISLLAPKCKILPIRAFTKDGLADAFTVATAIKYAADHGANVINLSFGSSQESRVLTDAVSDARDRGLLLVAAVGNENTDTDPQFPARLSDCMGIAAIDINSEKASFSNFGSDVSVDAFGVGLISTYPGGGYAKWSGTSFASPLAAAEAALVVSAAPRGNTRKTIEDSAVNVDHLSFNRPFSGKLGKGRIDPLNALNSSLGGGTESSPTGTYASIVLLPVEGELHAHGQAGFSINGDLQKMRVECEELGVRARYSVLVDGIAIANPITTNFGYFEVQLSSAPDSESIPLPENLLPVSTIRHVQVRDSQDHVLLYGEFRPVVNGSGPVGQSVQKETRLDPTGLIPQAIGKAGIDVDSERETVTVQAQGLPLGVVVVGIDGYAQSYDVPSYGFFKLEMTSDASNGLQLPQALRPVTSIKHVEIRTTSGQLLLQGDFQPGGADIGGGHEGGSGDGGGDHDGGGGGSSYEFEGSIQSLPSGSLIGDWMVSGRLVHVTAATEIKQDKGPIAVGKLVEVRGTVGTDNSVTASEIETKSSSGGGGGGGHGGGGGGGESISFQGNVQSLPAGGLIGDWNVSGQLVHVSSATRIGQDKGPITLGAPVEIKGSSNQDGSVSADEVERR